MRKAPWVLAMLAVGVAAPSVVGSTIGTDPGGWSSAAALFGILCLTVLSGVVALTPPVRRLVNRWRLVLVGVPPAIAMIASLAMLRPGWDEIRALVCCGVVLLVGIAVPIASLAATWARRSMPDGLGSLRIAVAAASLWLLAVWFTTFASADLFFEPIDCMAREATPAEVLCTRLSARGFRFAGAVLALSAVGVSLALRARTRSKRSLLPLVALALWFATQAVVDALHHWMGRALCEAGAVTAPEVPDLVRAASIAETVGLTLSLFVWSAAGVFALAAARRDGALRSQWRVTWPIIAAVVLASGAPITADRSGAWLETAVLPTTPLPFVLAALATLVLAAVVFVRELRRADRRCAGAIEAAPSADARVVPSWVDWRLATMRQPRELHPYRATLDAPEVALAPRAALWKMLARIARTGAWRAIRGASIWTALAFALCFLWWLLLVASG